MLSGIDAVLVKWTITLLPTCNRNNGPGTIPLNVMAVATTPLPRSTGASIATRNVSRVFGSELTLTASGRMPWPWSLAMGGGPFCGRVAARTRLIVRTSGHAYAEARERIHVIAFLPPCTRLDKHGMSSYQKAPGHAGGRSPFRGSAGREARVAHRVATLMDCQARIRKLERENVNKSTRT